MSVESSQPNQQTLWSLSLAALGVVFGDIGTSPLYAMRASLSNSPINLPDVLGVLSLIFWALIIVISIKYLIVVFRANNNGEGGILALLALLRKSDGRLLKLLFIIGILGAGLMLGDGMLTPAISVLSAIEGLNVVTPVFSAWILPLACVLLIGLFMVQSFGSAKIGFMFGPVLLLWFITAATIGGIQIVHNPEVLKAVNPAYAYHYLVHHGWSRYALLGGVFLVMTGGEALYADLGHFGKRPIRVSWFSVVLPALLINYFGQGAYLLAHPDAIVNPFFMMSARWFLWPLIILATLATVIASQAVISATFSLTKQAVLLGLYPRMPIQQTSASEQGQVYVPQMNIVLGVGTLLLILAFKSSAALAHAYGIAVNLTMLLTTFLVACAAYKLWKWNIIYVLIVFSIFLFIDFAFLAANMQKVLTGGWVPVLFAIACAFIMYTWHKGVEYFREIYYKKGENLEELVQQLKHEQLNTLPDVTAVFITDVYDKTGIGLLRFLILNRILPEHLLIVSYKIHPVPHIIFDQRYDLYCLDKNICQLTLNYGFMDFISVPRALSSAHKNELLPFKFKTDTAIYFVESHNIMPSYKKKSPLFFIQKKMFAFLIHNYSVNLNIEFYQLPYERTIAIGTYHVI